MTGKQDPIDRAIWLEAVSIELNVERAYSIEPSRDLFGAIVVRCAWGRIGTRGQARIVSFSDVEEARRFVKARIKDRSTALKRIGAAYKRIDDTGRRMPLSPMDFQPD